jgi:DNA-directed RNA polymerase subunit alpha
LDVFDTAATGDIAFKDFTKEADDRQNRIRKLRHANVNEIEMSVRAANCPNDVNIMMIGDLILKTETEILRCINFGNESLNEIKEKMEEIALSSGITIGELLLES